MAAIELTVVLRDLLTKHPDFKAEAEAVAKEPGEESGRPAWRAPWGQMQGVAPNAMRV
jgi:hypothetical protein